MRGFHDERPKVLIVDDERPLVEAFARRLDARLDVSTATSPTEALACVNADGPFPVVVTDQHMPGTSGLSLVAAIRGEHPDTVFILLTGDPGQSIAADAINQAGVFRFLRKPCGPNELEEAILAADRHHRVAIAEKSLLRETLAGCVRMLLDALGTAAPETRRRGRRIRSLVSELVERLPYPKVWTLGVASQLALLGELVLPVDPDAPAGSPTRRRRVAQAGCDLVRHIPRMEPVAEILAALDDSGPLPPTGSFADGDEPEAIMFASRVIRFAVDWTLAADDIDGDLRRGLETLMTAGCDHDPHLLIAAHAILTPATRSPQPDHRPNKPRHKAPDQCDVQTWISGNPAPADVRSHEGLLLIAEGIPLTTHMLECVRAFDRAGLLRHDAA